jgi:hypothetical protein
MCVTLTYSRVDGTRAGPRMIHLGPRLLLNARLPGFLQPHPPGLKVPVRPEYLGCLAM